MTIKFGFCVAAVLGASLLAAPANAQVTTYHFEPGAGNKVYSGTRLLTGVPGPFTFDFTLANALAANSTFSLGVAGVNPGFNGNIIDLRFSGGNALSTFTLADFSLHPADRFARIGANTGARIQVDTDANGAIKAYEISVVAISPVDPTLIFFGSITTGRGIEEALYYIDRLGYPDNTAGVAGCGGACGIIVSSHVGGITGNGGGGNGGGGGGGAGAVPEPATWALMIVGFGLVGAVRRRQARPLVRIA